MNKIDQLKARYEMLFGFDHTPPEVLVEIEQRLHVELPSDFKSIALFYCGGFLGGKSHHSIATKGPANNIVEETIRLRNAIQLPNRYLVLAEPPASLMVMDTQDGCSKVIWCDAVDSTNLLIPSKLNNPQIWRTYLDFFNYLIEEEENERN